MDNSKTPNRTWRAIQSIEMATDTDVYETVYKGGVSVKAESNGGEGFDIFTDDEEADWRESYDDAVEEAITYIVDQHLIIKGYGTHSGRKFWQLPEDIQEAIIKAASR